MKQIKNYIVLYFDLLGVRRLLGQLRNRSDANVIELEKLVQKYSAAIQLFMENFYQLYDGFKNRRRETLSRMLPGMKIDDAIVAARVDVGIQQFSDTSMFYVENAGPVAWIIVQKMLIELSAHMFDLMEHEIYLRGCLTVGEGWEIGQNCLFGQVLEDCYTVEQKVARYQRIVVTNEFEKQLRNVLNHLDEDGRHYWTSLFEKDYDGVLIFDYVEAFRVFHQMDVEVKLKTQLSQVESKCRSYKEDGDFELAEKYYHCMDYLRRACK